jgi:3-hydroxyisobutyrate dehydrogenase
MSSELPSPKNVGFIGLGNMGGRMTRCIVDRGTPVFGFDPIAAAITACGATPARSGAEVAARSDIILLSLPDSKIVEAVFHGDAGIFDSLCAGQIIVDLSTAAPASTLVLSAQLKDKGVAYLDAGISGGAAAAEKGALTLMVGGDPDALASVRPVLELFATNIFHMGVSGAGHTTKLLNNFLNAVSLASTAEVMVAGKKAGLDLETLLEVVNVSSGVNFATLNRFPHIIQGDYLNGGLSNTLMMKDVVLYIDLVRELGVASLNSAGPLSSFGLARALGYADQISNTVVDAIGDISGGIRLHAEAAPTPTQ